MTKPLGGAATLTVCLLAAVSEAQLPLEPMKKSGQSVTPAYEGWYRNADGSYTLLVGYFNRNHEEALDIPVGPDNRIEPGGPDRGQPTHFLPRRQWGVFTIRVPADFPGKKLTWHIVANNKPMEVPMGLDPLWEVRPYKDDAKGNTPPSLKFTPDGPVQHGPPETVIHSLEAKVSQPVTLKVWASDDGVVDEYRRSRAIDPPVRVSWSKFRGPGDVWFENLKPEVSKEDGTATTTATFSVPGEYILRLQGNDISGNGGTGAQCCWTNAHVRVTVHPATDSQD